jgi:hypothetical protein
MRAFSDSQKYMRAPQWLSKAMIVAERCWHFPQCCYATSFSKVHASPLVILKNSDVCWDGSTFYSMLLRDIVFKSTCEPLNDFQKPWLQPRGIDIFFNAAMQKFQKYMRAPQWFKRLCFLLRGVDMFLNAAMRHHFQKDMRAPQWLPKTMIIAERGWDLPQCRYATSFPKVHASPSMTLKSNDYSWEGVTFSSMLLRKIVFKSTCEPLNDSQKQWFPD